MASLLCTFVQAILLTSLEATLPLYLHEQFSYGSAQTALTFTALMIPSLFSPVVGKKPYPVLASPSQTNLPNPETGKLCNRFGNRSVLAIAFLGTGITIILLRLPTSHDTANQAGMIVLLTCVGFAINSVLTPIMTEIFQTVEQIEEAQPGCLGENGAFAQSVGKYPFSQLPLLVSAHCVTSVWPL